MLRKVKNDYLVIAEKINNKKYKLFNLKTGQYISTENQQISHSDITSAVYIKTAINTLDGYQPIKDVTCTSNQIYKGSSKKLITLNKKEVYNLISYKIEPLNKKELDNMDCISKDAYKTLCKILNFPKKAKPTEVDKVKQLVDQYIGKLGYNQFKQIIVFVPDSSGKLRVWNIEEKKSEVLLDLGLDLSLEHIKQNYILK